MMSSQDENEREVLRNAFNTIQAFIFESTDRISTGEYVNNMSAIQRIYNKMKYLYPDICTETARNPEDDEYVPEDYAGDDYDNENENEDENEDEVRVDRNICRCTDRIRYHCKRSIISVVRCGVFSKLIEDFPMLELVRGTVLDDESCYDKVFNIQLTAAEFQIQVTDNSQIVAYLNKILLIMSIFEMFTVQHRLIMTIAIINHVIKVAGHVDIIKHNPSIVGFIGTIIGKIEFCQADDHIIRRFNRLRNNFNVDFPFPQWLDEFRRIRGELG
jgi:hypothetical protein